MTDRPGFGHPGAPGPAPTGQPPRARFSPRLARLAAHVAAGGSPSACWASWSWRS